MLSNEWTIEEVRHDMIICRHHAQVIMIKREDLDTDDVPVPGQRVLDHGAHFELVGAAKRAADLETTRDLPSIPEKPEEFGK